MMRHDRVPDLRGALTGIRVLDLTTVIMGPYASQLLADQGADVIKIEAPEGDLIRHITPQRKPGMSGMFLNLHRNKRSVVLDLKREEARAALLKLVATADVFMHNMRPKAIQRLGLGYEDLKHVKPDIVYCASIGFGSGGPYANKPAYDDVIQAASGLSAMFGRVTGAPAFYPGIIADKITGQMVAASVLTAIIHKLRTGEGQAIEVPMFETVASFNLVEHIGAHAYEPAIGPSGWMRVLSPFRKPFATKDGHMCLMPYSNQNWKDFFAFIGEPEWADDPRFATFPLRAQHTDLIYGIVERVAVKFTNAEWIAFCDRASIPAMPVLSVEDLFEDAHMQAVGMFDIDTHPHDGPYKRVRPPVRYSATPPQMRRHSPMLGEHTREVLAEVGYSEAEVTEIAGAPKTAAE